jgi:hypothetical protein
MLKPQGMDLGLVVKKSKRREALARYNCFIILILSREIE